MTATLEPAVQSPAGPPPSVAPARAAVTAQPGRLAWIDNARGVIMVAVVVLHVGLYQMLPITAAAGGPAHDFWVTTNNLLGAIRMPALLVISGWLAATTLASGPRSERVRRRVATNGWLFGLWMTVYAVLTGVLHAEGAAQSVPWSRLLLQLLLPDSTLWFLAALVWYTLALSALRSAPSWAVLLGLLVLAAVTDPLPTSLGLWVKIPQFAVFFALGAYAKGDWSWIAAHPLLALPGGAVASWACIEWENYQTQVTHEWAFASATALSLAMAVTLFAAAGFVTRYLPLLGRPFAVIGRNTVAVYVLHFPALLVLSHVPALNNATAVLLAHQAVQWVYPVAVAGLIVAGSLATKRITERLGARWLWALPTLRDVPWVRLAAPAPIRGQAS